MIIRFFPLKGKGRFFKRNAPTHTEKRLAPFKGTSRLFLTDSTNEFSKSIC